MKNKLLITISLLLALFITACDHLNDPGEIEFHNSAFIVLKTGNQRQQFFIYNSLPMKYDFGASSHGKSFEFLAEDYFSRNAKFLITSDNFQYDMFHAEGGDSLNYHKYYTNSSELLIQPSRKYAVRIESGKNVMTGEVVAVGSFNLNIVREGSSGNIYQVKWSRADNARYYRVRLSIFYTDYLYTQPPKSTIQERNYFIDPDTVRGSSLYAQKVNVPGGYDSAKISVEACDVNIYNYFYKQVKRSNISNAYGFVGSASVMEVKIY